MFRTFVYIKILLLFVQGFTNGPSIRTHTKIHATTICSRFYKWSKHWCKYKYIYRLIVKSFTNSPNIRT